jgi:hypothetical protein
MSSSYVRIHVRIWSGDDREIKTLPNQRWNAVFGQG